MDFICESQQHAFDFSDYLGVGGDADRRSSSHSVFSDLDGDDDDFDVDNDIMVNMEMEGMMNITFASLVDFGVELLSGFEECSDLVNPGYPAVKIVQTSAGVAMRNVMNMVESMGWLRLRNYNGNTVDETLDRFFSAHPDAEGKRELLGEYMSKFESAGLHVQCMYFCKNLSRCVYLCKQPNDDGGRSNLVMVYTFTGISPYIDLLTDDSGATKDNYKSAVEEFGRRHADIALPKNARYKMFGDTAVYWVEGNYEPDKAKMSIFLDDYVKACWRYILSENKIFKRGKGTDELFDMSSIKKGWQMYHSLDDYGRGAKMKNARFLMILKSPKSDCVIASVLVKDPEKCAVIISDVETFDRTIIPFFESV